MLPANHNVVVERVDDMTVIRDPTVPLQDILDAIEAPGEILKTSSRYETRRVKNWVVKTSGQTGLHAALKHTILRERGRKAWRAARHLQAHGVGCGAPLAMIEWKRAGFIRRRAIMTTYLDGCSNVETFMQRMLAQRASHDKVRQFLENLSAAVGRLCACGAYHSDLSGKNILTSDGSTFYFVDLDGVCLNRPYTRRRRLRNHVQLYDSFCDYLGEEYLGPFITRLAPENCPPESWLSRVRRGQAARRRRHLRRRRP